MKQFQNIVAPLLFFALFLSSFSIGSFDQKEVSLTLLVKIFALFTFAKFHQLLTTTCLPSFLISFCVMNYDFFLVKHVGGPVSQLEMHPP